MYEPPKIIETEIFSRVPDQLHLTARRSRWIERREGSPLPFFLEGPSFDRAGHLFCVDIAHSRLFRIDPAGAWSVFAQYDGEPNGLKIHKDGRIFVADHHYGLVAFDPATAAMTVVCAGPEGGAFLGLNDLVFAANGDLYMTDQGESALENPSGRVFRLRASGELDLLMDGLPSPNGLVLDRSESVLHVAMTRSSQILSLPLVPGYRGIRKARMFIQMSGGGSGPDGMARDEAGGLAVVHSLMGTVWIFSPLGEPLYRVRSCAGLHTTNCAYGGPDRRTLYITETGQGVILQARLPVAGAPMYAQM